MDIDALRSLRRELHQTPEPSWCEFYTTAKLYEELSSREPTELFVGPDALAEEVRMDLPDTATQQQWYDRARESGASPAVLEQLEGGKTGLVAVFERGPGPTVGLRVDIDGLLIEESEDSTHAPTPEGFRSQHSESMHACGHDAHMTIGMGVIDQLCRPESEFQGTLKVFFQPAEEVIGGGKAMAESGHLDDVDYLLSLHIGLNHPTGEIVAGIDGFLAVSHLEATFSGESAHAGARPEAGRNTMQAMATAIQNLYGIPRHSGGATRVNVGRVESGSASNIIADETHLVAEVRGETTALMEYMAEKAATVLESAATMHDCSVELEWGARAPSATSDRELATIVGEVAETVDGIERVIESDHLGGSEDATYLMQAVQQKGGLACYMGVGTDHPGGHHTPTFDVDEVSLRHGVAVLSGAIERISLERP